MGELITAGKMILAGLVTLPIAINRERHTRIMGIRTFPLVAIGTCGFILLTQTFIGPDNPDAAARIIQGILSGIGFVGGGAILKNDDHVKGTECAAGIWVTGGIGAAIAYDVWTVAAVLSFSTFLIFYFLTPLKTEDHPAEDA
ncbi:MAG: MgtC/SapB family protein [Verrucomicrobiales bacterium]|nr:MgtC/SapB family protein [Verrucomicrobiales bacterium]